MFGWIPRHRCLVQKGVSQENKGGGIKKRPADLSLCPSPPEGKNDVTVDTTAGVHLGTQLPEPDKPSAALKLTAVCSGLSVHAASMDAAPRLTSPRASGDVAGLSSVAAGGTIPNAHIPELESRQFH
jgi:hypothetical protein